MTASGLFTVRAFAEFARTTRDILHHYDKIGLLSPSIRGKNRYRYYSISQLALLNLIRTMQKLGMTLSEIKELREYRTPESMDELFSNQIENIDRKIEEWVSAKKLLLTLHKSIRETAGINENLIELRQLPEEAIILGGQNDYSNARDDYDALASFYQKISVTYPELDLNYPVWGTFSEERIKRGDCTWPDRYYFYNPEGNDKRPAGLYVIGYTRGGYGRHRPLYKRLINYIGENGLVICGEAYEEYPLNEVSISDENNYLVRILIRVRRLPR